MAGHNIIPSLLKDGEYYIDRNTVVMRKLKYGKRKQNSPLGVREYRVMTVYDTFFNKWWHSSEMKKCSLGMDKTQPKKYRFALCIVKGGTLEAYHDNV